MQYQELTTEVINSLPTAELRKYWASAWQLKPHQEMSRTLLIKSLFHKIREANGQGLNSEQQARLDQLVKVYKKSSEAGVKRQSSLKSGTQIVREWQGARHVVTIENDLYEYNKKKYKSLSAIASEITGTRWNGWAFFGIKNPARTGDSK